MQKIILTYGFIAGAVIIGTIIIWFATGANYEHVAGLEWLGYLIMIVAFSLIFFGVKQYRDRELGGVIRFPTALKVGLGITLVASVVYVVAWEVNLAATDYAFINDYTQSLIDDRRAAGASEAEMAGFVAEMETQRAKYDNTLYRLMITFSEIFPVGLVIALVSAAILRRRNVLPAAGS